MSGRGVHFAITAEQAQVLLAATDDAARRAIIDELEDAWDADNAAESDDTWGVMHRCLTDGQLGRGNGEFPLNHAVMGPRQLHAGDECVISLVLPEEVVEVAHALELATAVWMTARYDHYVPADHPDRGPGDLAYLLTNLDDVRDLYRKAAVRGRAVVFTVER